MKVLFLEPVGEIGGAERVLLDLTRTLTARGVGCAAILGDDGPLVEALERVGVSTTVLPMPPALLSWGDSALREATPWSRLAPAFVRGALSLGGYARALQRRIRELEPDLLHSNGIKTHLLASLLPARVPRVWHLHDFLAERPAVSRLVKPAAWRVDGAVAISRAVEEEVRALLPRLRTACVPNGVDTVRFAPRSTDASRLDALAGLAPPPTGTLRLGLVAAYARWKGHALFLEAIRQCAGLPARFYLVGGPLYRTAGSQWSQQELRELARTLGVEQQVAFVPFQQDVPSVYASLDVVVHASTRREPFGLTIAEAMASGRPVISTALGGARELFEDGVDGLAAEATPDALGSAIRTLGEDSQLRRRLGDQARQTAVARFSLERQADGVMALYREVLIARGVIPPEHA